MAQGRRLGACGSRARLHKIKDDTPRRTGLLRAQLRRAAEIDFEKGGPGTDAYVALAEDYYEVLEVYEDFVPTLRERFDPAVAD